MLWSLLMMAIMGGLGLYAYATAHFAVTRQTALVPFAVCGMELLAAGLLDAVAFPALTAVLCVLRLAVVLCCVGAIRQDRRMWRRREARKASFARQMRCAEHPLHAVPSTASSARRVAGCA